MSWGVGATASLAPRRGLASIGRSFVSRDREGRSMFAEHFNNTGWLAGRVWTIPAACSTAAAVPRYLCALQHLYCTMRGWLNTQATSRRRCQRFVAHLPAALEVLPFKGQIPLRRLPRNFPAGMSRGSFGDVSGMSRTCDGQVGVINQSINLYYTPEGSTCRKQTQTTN